jgi:hypothetical protein
VQFPLSVLRQDSCLCGPAGEESIHQANQPRSHTDDHLQLQTDKDSLAPEELSALHQETLAKREKITELKKIANSKQAGEFILHLCAE